MKNIRPLSPVGRFSRFDETLHMEMDFSLCEHVSINGQVCCNVRFSPGDYVCKRETFPSSFLAGDNRAQLKCNVMKGTSHNDGKLKKNHTYPRTLYFCSSSIKANGFLFRFFFFYRKYILLRACHDHADVCIAI